jgi:hypothetical protein
MSRPVFLVKLRVAVIFKGIFETQKSTRNGENFAKSGALGTWAPAIYHPRINHAAPLYRLYQKLGSQHGSSSAFPCAMMEGTERPKAEVAGFKNHLSNKARFRI